MEKNQNWPRALVSTQLQILDDIFIQGFYADKVLERHFKQNRKLGSRDRRSLAETTYEIVRWLGLLDAVIRTLDGQLQDPRLLNSARWMTFEKLFHQTRILLEEELGGFSKKLDEGWEAAVTGLQPWERLAFPQWLFERLGENQKLLASLNQVAPVCLRVNTLKSSLEEASASLTAENVLTKASRLSPVGLVLNERKNIFTSETFKKGWIEVQDEGSQLIAPFLQVEAGQRVMDACAGAGGKTLHLAALMKNKGSLVAMDNHPKKLEQLKLRARRAGVSNLRIQLIDSTKVIKRHKGEFDRVLLDVPCSGTGVLRRNPDSKWKLDPPEVERLQQLQKEILTGYAGMTKAGGKLVYATCSLLDAENQAVVDGFLKSEAGQEWSVDGKSLSLRPDREGCDGFFASRLIRRSK